MHFVNRFGVSCDLGLASIDTDLWEFEWLLPLESVRAVLAVQVKVLEVGVWGPAAAVTTHGTEDKEEQKEGLHSAYT